MKQKLAHILFLGGALVLPSVALAVGLGEPRQEPVLGQRLDLSIPLLGVDGAVPDGSCFRVVKPRSGEDLPWVKQADVQVVPGKSPRLRLRSDVVREPLFQVAIDLGCGNDLYREYTLLANPVLTESVPAVTTQDVAEKLPVSRRKRERSEVRRAASRAQAVPALPLAGDQQLSTVGGQVLHQPLAAATQGGGDRFFLSANDDGGEASLRLSMVLGEHMLRETAFTQEQREALRLEYRMLAALHERATDQLAVAEKLRSMEAALTDLQGRAAGLQARAAAVEDAPLPQAAAVPAAPLEEASSDWGWYGLLLALVLLLAGGLYWRQRQARDADNAGLLHAEPLVDAPRQAELSAPSRAVAQQVDLHLEPAAANKPLPVDFELGGTASVAPVVPAKPQPRPGDSIFSINATTVDEHFEANPVMELADIMLSFGRVKGAAQALQEYIDNNPQEALQPWVRLLEVYRMANMREEFDAVASNLNQHFNVEIQPWEPTENGSSGSEPEDVAIVDAAQSSDRARSVEDMPRIVAALTKQWSSPEVLDYMQQLLRDNRSGQRQGFPLPVVEDILFLIELKETELNIERELADA